MNKILPDYLLEKRHQIVTVIVTIVISVGFLCYISRISINICAFFIYNLV
ncbi:MAG TPA: hypothetical protein PLI69_04395 [Bacteroidales bacterium]|nr:hypothetical protein [Bacteroidales bacterium]